MGFDGFSKILGFRWCKQRMGLEKEGDGVGGGLANMGLREGNGKSGVISEQIMAGGDWKWRKTQWG